MWTPPVAIDFSELRFKVTTADVYPAWLRGLIDRRREPRWIFARFHLSGARALAEAMPVQTTGSGSDGGDPFRIFRHSIAIVGEVLSRRIFFQAARTESLAS
jgi:hypothetical protein